MTAMSQIVSIPSSAKYHSLCVAPKSVLSHIVKMNSADKNGGPVTLRAWRTSREMSQAALAEAVGTNANMIGYLESGERALTTLWMRKLAPHLGAKPSQLIDDEPGASSFVPNATVLTSTFAVLLDSVGIDPYQDGRAQKLAESFPDVLSSMSALQAQTAAAAPTRFHAEASPDDDGDRKAT